MQHGMKPIRAYIARFSANSIKTMVAYGKHGNWFYTIQRYDEKNLPANVRGACKRHLL